MSLLVTNIQRFSLDDGLGIRTTVFLKGCSLKCPWCCNPENIQNYPEFYFKQDLCLQESQKTCNECLRSCQKELLLAPNDLLKQNESCLNCLKCITSCPTKSIGVYGFQLDWPKFLAILNKDRHFFHFSNGGITFSGGEPLLQAIELRKFLVELRNIKVNTCIETSLFVSSQLLNIVKDLVDHFYVDIKLLSSEECNLTLKGNLDQYLKNLDILLQNGNDIIFRIPWVIPYTYNENNIQLIIKLIREKNLKKIEIFSYHSFGYHKYNSLGISPPQCSPVANDSLEALRKQLSLYGAEVSILNI